MTWKNTKGRIAAAFIYTTLFIAALAAFIINGTDENALALKLESIIKQNSNAEVKIGTASLSLPISLTLTDVTVNDNAGTRLKIEQISLRPLLLPLLTGSLAAKIVAKTGGGELAINISTSRMGTQLSRIKVKAENFAIHEIIISAQGNSLPLQAEISGSGELEFAPNSIDLAQSTGSITVSLAKVKITAAILGKTLLKNLSPEKASCTLTIEKRRLTTKQCEAVTAAGKFALRVTSQLLKRVEASPLRGTLVVTPAEGPLKRFLGIYPNRRRPGGGYHFPLKGTLANPGINL